MLLEAAEVRVTLTCQDSKVIDLASSQGHKTHQDCLRKSPCSFSKQKEDIETQDLKVLLSLIEIKIATTTQRRTTVHVLTSKTALQTLNHSNHCSTATPRRLIKLCLDQTVNAKDIADQMITFPYKFTQDANFRMDQMNQQGHSTKQTSKGCRQRLANRLKGCCRFKKKRETRVQDKWLRG